MALACIRDCLLEGLGPSKAFLLIRCMKAMDAPDNIALCGLDAHLDSDLLGLDSCMVIGCLNLLPHMSLLLASSQTHSISLPLEVSSIVKW